MEMFDEHRPHGWLTIAIDVVKQGDAIAALTRSPAPRLHLALNEVLGAEGSCARAVALDNQDIAVRQSINDARMQQSRNYRLNIQALTDGRRLPWSPAYRLRNAHRRQ